MGGQQFATDAPLLDTRELQRVLSFDPERGLIEVEAGIQWPRLVEHLISDQQSVPGQWGIRQKQTGADRFTIGGSLSANGHGRGLTMSPLVGDVESLCVVGWDGRMVECSRSENDELFRLAIGGYGLFGVIYSATLRLSPRRKLERVVEVGLIDDLIDRFAARIDDGFLYGDFQFSTNERSSDYLRKGVFSCYRPTDPDRPIPGDQRALTREDWGSLLLMAHTDKEKAFSLYSEHYLATSGQIYWSDLHQFADYVDGYHRVLDGHLGAIDSGSEMISEVYVPRPLLADFMAAVAREFRGRDADVIYGTIRLIERDDETALPWAKDDYACVIFNLHTVHSHAGIEHSAAAFRALIDLAIERGGSYFLTYHPWATAEQLTTCYPGFQDVLRAKDRYDPDRRFQSDWFRHYSALLEQGA
jgi:FAD/FMN-containing dehydrogenase